MLTPPKTEADFTRIAKQYIGSTLGNEFSNTLGNDFKGRKATHVEIIGVYENEVLVMSRKIGDKEASFNKYEPVSGWHTSEGYRIEALPLELARHLTPVTPPQTPVITYTPATRAPTQIPTRSSIPTPEQQETRYAPGPTYQSEPIPAGPCLCDDNHYDCCDFSNQEAAQACYDYCLRETERDVHRLNPTGGAACGSASTAKKCGW